MDGRRRLFTYRLPGNSTLKEPDSVFLQSCVSTGQGECIDKPWRGIITKDGYKYVCFEEMEWLLYDLNNDPYEQINLVHYGNCHALLARMNQRLQEWLDQTDDTFHLPNHFGTPHQS